MTSVQVAPAGSERRPAHDVETAASHLKLMRESLEDWLGAEAELSRRRG